MTIIKQMNRFKDLTSTVKEVKTDRFENLTNHRFENLTHETKELKESILLTTFTNYKGNFRFYQGEVKNGQVKSLIKKFDDFEGYKKYILGRFGVSIKRSDLLCDLEVLE